MKKIKFVKDHTCEAMKNIDNISIEEYNINDSYTNWYHHLHLDNENDKLISILYCKYCAKDLYKED